MKSKYPESICDQNIFVSSATVFGFSVNFLFKPFFCSSNTSSFICSRTIFISVKNASTRDSRYAGPRSLCTTISQERRLGIAIRTLQEKPPVAMHPDVRALLARAAQECGVQATEMVSGAGHDAQILVSRCRVGMLFVPSIGGRSHCPEESTNPEHVRLGTEVLARSLELLAY